MVFTDIIAAVSYTTILAAVAAVAALKVVPNVGLWATDKVMSFIKRR